MTWLALSKPLCRLGEPIERALKSVSNRLHVARLRRRPKGGGSPARHLHEKLPSCLRSRYGASSASMRNERAERDRKLVVIADAEEYKLLAPIHRRPPYFSSRFSLT